jgi:phosphatidylglycerophosphatase A
MGIALAGVYILYNVFGEFDFNIVFLSDIDALFILTFIIFRFFDISKIGPVGWVENNQNEKPYNRVIGDDIMASFLTIFVIVIVLSINLWVL